MALMTTYWEEKQPGWYASGLAAVLASPSDGTPDVWFDPGLGSLTVHIKN